jgi:uncharacterized protein YndB with AHSA1/START domain
MTHNESDAAAIIIECELPESREKVWQALTVPELLAKWLLPDDGSIECNVLEVEPQRRLRLSWREVERTDQPAYDHTLHSVVTFELSETLTGGTHLRLVHEGFEVRQTRVAATNILQLQPRRTRRTRKPVAALNSCSIQLRRAA